jgi:hypothetical protein
MSRRCCLAYAFRQIAEETDRPPTALRREMSIALLALQTKTLSAGQDPAGFNTAAAAAANAGSGSPSPSVFRAATTSKRVCERAHRILFSCFTSPFQHREAYANEQTASV